jgi:hypothetical protein
MRRHSIPVIRRVLPVIAALAALFNLAAHGLADEPIRWKFTVGEKLAYNVTTDMNLAIKTGQNSPMNSSIHQVMEMTWDVQGVNDAGEAVIQLSFDHAQMKITGPMTVDYDSAKDSTATGMAAAFAPIYKAMKNNPFEITMTSRGEIKDVKVPKEVLDALKSSPGAAQMGDLATPEGFQKMFMQGSFTLPEKAPEKGEHWSTSVTISSPIGGKQTTETSYTYEGSKEVNGETIAQFRPAMTMTFEGNAQMQMKVKDQKSDGEMLFNEKQGRMDSMTLKQDVTMEVTVATQTLQQHINQNIQVKLEPKGSDAKGQKEAGAAEN